MMSRSRRSGFTLIELLVAVAIFGVMAGGLTVFYGMVFGSQYRKFADLTVANGATFVRRAFDSAMGSATYIQDPAPPLPVSASYLTVWTNRDVDGSTSLVTTVTPQFSYLCCTPAGACTQIYLYQGSAAVPGNCGDAPAAGVTRTLLVGGPGFQSASLAFYRPDPNLVQMKCGITLTDKRGLKHSVELWTQAVMSANGQK